MKKGNPILLTGNHAVSHAVRLARPAVMPVYPITPQTPVLEKLAEFHSQGKLDAKIITPESEHSAMAACISASLTGARVFTATASQGLLLMHELLHYAAGARTSIVLFNINRTIGSPWGFWPDQTDSLAQRDTGWIQFYTESGQESFDTLFHAFKIAEWAQLPVMISHEAFYVSHALEPVNLVEQAVADSFLPPFNPPHKIDPQNAESWGNVVNQEVYNRHRFEMGESINKVEKFAQEADDEWKHLTGRGYGNLEKYRFDDASIIVLTMGSIAGTTRVAIDKMREEGISVGLLKIRLFRPFPVESLRKLLAGKEKVLVLDRNFSPGGGGVLHQEIRAALFGLENSPVIYGYLAGVGGVNLPPEKIEGLIQRSIEEEAEVNPIWVR